MKRRRAPLLAVLAALGAFACADAGAGRGGGDSGRATPIALSYHASEQLELLRFENYRSVVERAAPAYVRVIIRSKGDGGGTESVDKAGGVINGASGVIVDAAGHVVTAAHIALDPRNAAEIVGMDGRTRPARILRVERGRELALLQIAPFPGMQPATLADSDRLAKGDPAFAIGTPDNRGGVVSLGRVVDPKLAQRLDYNGFGFADAIKIAIAVQPGNSGGPVFDRDGRLLGIVGAFGLDNAEDFDPQRPPLGYAVPANAIRAMIAGR